MIVHLFQAFAKVIVGSPKDISRFPASAIVAFVSSLIIKKMLKDADDWNAQNPKAGDELTAGESG